MKKPIKKHFNTKQEYFDWYFGHIEEKEKELIVRGKVEEKPKEKPVEEKKQEEPVKKPKDKKEDK